MNEPQLPESILNVISSSTFADLEDKMKSDVLAHMSSEEYDKINQSMSLFFAVDKGLDEQLKADFDSSVIMDQKINTLPTISIKRGMVILTIVAISAFLLGRYSVQDSAHQNELIFAANQDTLGSSLARDFYPKELMVSF